MEVITQRIRKIKLGLKITSIMFLIWALFSKMDSMDGAANVLLFFSGSISGVILIVEYVYGRFVKWVSTIEGIPANEFIMKSVRKYAESIRESS